MNLFLYCVLFLVTVLYFLLLSSFESFTRISLARFIRKLTSKKKMIEYYIEEYDQVFLALKTFVFILQVPLYIFSYHYIRRIWDAPIAPLLALTFFFVFFFYLFLSIIAYLKKEFVFKNFFFILPLAWYLLYPMNFLFGVLIRKHQPDEAEVMNDEISDQELEVFFEESTRDGVIDQEDKEMIQSVLEFGDTLVKEVMTPRVDMIHVSVDAKLDEIVAVINENKKSRYPVISEKIDNVVGIILSKDVFNSWNNPSFRIKDILRPPFFVPETMRIIELIKELQKDKQKFAIVVDEFGGVSGIVTMEDIVEEIVGEIKDEYDDEPDPITQHHDYFIARGDTNIFEMYETLNINIEEVEDFQTVAGLISFKLGKIPQEQDKITDNGWIFEVLEIEKNRIKKVKIYREKEPAQA